MWASSTRWFGGSFKRQKYNKATSQRDKLKTLSLDPSFEFTNSAANRTNLVEPYAKQENVDIMKKLQELESIGFVEPIGEKHMYFAAMHSKACKLTDLGMYYWLLVKRGRV